jgi:septal ring factor EnvC (AmiA/AmiB activator)
LLPKNLQRFLIQKVCLLLFTCFFVALFVFHSESIFIPFFLLAFEESLWKLPASELSKFNVVLSLKTVVVGRLVSEQLVAKLSDESRDLKRDLENTQTSNLDLYKQIKELKESLKKSHEEKKLVDVALRNLKKDHDKLAKAHDNDLKMIQNLRKYVDKSIIAINEPCGANAELVTRNVDLAKTLSTREKTILNLEKVLTERCEAMSKGAEGIR